MTPSLEGPCGKPAVSLSRRLGRSARPALVLAGLVLGGLVLGGLCGPGPASADELTDEQENDAIVYAWDNAVFTLYHEIGHMLIDLYKIPVLAKEEDGADNLATLMALEDYNRDGDPIIMDAAYGWAAWMKEDDFTRMTAGDFYDEHSISTQRAFWMICMLVGSNKPEFGEIATRFGLSDDRQDLCADEYEKTKRSWDAVMAPHAKPNAGKPKVSFRYGKPGDATVDGRDILADNTVLETVAKRIDSLYTLPVPVMLKGEDCETPNAFYDPADHTITLCYEMVQQYYDQYRNALLAGADPTSVEPRSRFTVTFGAMTLGAVAVGQAPAANAPEDLSQKGIAAEPGVRENRRR